MWNVDSYKKLIKSIQSSNSPIILWAIPSDEYLHPCATDVSLLFIKVVNDKTTYSLSFNHPDMTPFIDKGEVINDLNMLMVNKWTINKKSCLQIFPVKGLLDFELFSHLQRGEILGKELYETPAHRFIYRSKMGSGDLNLTIPLLKHKEKFEKMCDTILGYNLYLVDEEEGYKKENEIIIETLAELESNGIYVNPDCFRRHFDARIQPNGLVYSQYSIYTSTGRPSNSFENVNYAALNKENGARTCFVSRYDDDGCMVLIDYSSFHPRIICNLIDFHIPVDQDIYKYLGEMYFGRKVNEYDMEEVKKITMRQLYGGVEEQYEHIKYFGSLNTFINDNWSYFDRHGYVLTPIFKRKITDKHILSASPTKLFNYILQATETELAMSVVKMVSEYLRNKKTKAILYTYDSLLFDFHKEDGAEVLSDIVKIMTVGNRFPIKVYKGPSYDSITQIYP